MPKGNVDEFRAALKADLEKHQEALAVRANNESKTALQKLDAIWHYTTTHSALKILMTNTMRFTERSHLNDPSELSYSFELAMDEAGKIGRRNSVSERLEDWLSHVRSGVARSAVTTHFQFFVGSFSAADNSLSQWRLYADDGKGVALGFTPVAFDDSNAAVGEKPQTFLVSYDESVLRAYNRGILETLVGRFESFDIDLDLRRTGPAGEVMDDVAFTLLLSGLLFKHPEYSNEREFRVLVLHDPRRGASYAKHKWHGMRERNGEVVHYIDWPIQPPLSQPGVLRGVRTGPASPPALSAQIESAFASLGYPVPDIAKSKLPYRSLR